MSRTLDYTKQGFSMSEGGWGTRRRNLVIKAILSLHKENIGKLLDPHIYVTANSIIANVIKCEKSTLMCSLWRADRLAWVIKNKFV